MGPMSLHDIVMAFRRYNHLGTREWYVDASRGTIYSSAAQVQVSRAEGDEIARKYLAGGEPVTPAVPTLDPASVAASLNSIIERIASDDLVRYADLVPLCDAVKILEAMSRPTPTPPAEPSAEECLAAINRARHRGWGDWRFLAHHGDGSTYLDPDELLGLGRLLIERERAAAKGGAAHE